MDHAFPGWIEVAVRAADGRTHRVIEKVPVLTDLPLTIGSTFPHELWLRGTSDRADRTTADVRFAYDVTTTEGLPGLTVETKDVVWL